MKTFVLLMHLIKFYSMFRVIMKYPLSIIVIIMITYLSLFKPPKTSLNTIENLDKVVHMCMYLGLSGVIWFEYLRKHTKDFNLKTIIIYGGGFPILFGGLMELAQKYLTTNREGDWLDFTANSAGVILACLIGYYILLPLFTRKSIS